MGFDKLFDNALLSDVVLDVDRAERALSQGRLEAAKRFLLRAMMTYNSVTLKHQQRSDLQEAVLIHLKQVALKVHL